MNKTTEALKLAEEALAEVTIGAFTRDCLDYHKALAAIREALADHIAASGKVIAEPVKQEPIGDELAQYKRMFESACSALAAISDALLVDPEEGGVEPILAAIADLKDSALQPVKQGPVATEHPLVAYAESYEQIARSDSSGKVSALAVATDIRQNMIPLTAANVDLSVLRPRNWTREMSDAWHRAIPNLEKAFDDLIAAFKEKNK